MPTNIFPLASLLDQSKSKIRGARFQAMQAANTELLGLYWRIGSLILAQ